jgi:hypothetical protein
MSHGYRAARMYGTLYTLLALAKRPNQDRATKARLEESAERLLARIRSDYPRSRARRRSPRPEGPA